MNTIGQTAITVSRAGLGTGPLGGLYRESPREEAMNVLEHAWTGGIRYFDTAPFYGYGLAERRVGDFLQGRPSDQWRLSTKVGRLLRKSNGKGTDTVGFVNALKFGVEFDYSYDGIMRSIEDSYARLGLTKIDIAYVHDLGSFVHSPERAQFHLGQLRDSGYDALEKLKSGGAIGAYGIGVNEVEICQTILAEADLDCILLANRFTLLDRSGEAELLPLCRRRNVSIIAGGVFNSGILATGAVDGAHFEYAPASSDILGRVRSMEKLAASGGYPLTRAALAFPFSDPAVKCVLIGADTVPNLKSSLEQLKHDLEPAELERYRPFALTAHA